MTPVDPLQFQTIYQKYFGFVWSLVRRSGVGNDAIDDVVQEVFVVIHSKLPTLKQPDSVASWIYGIVRRKVSDHRRAQRTRDTSSAELAREAELQMPPQRTPADLSQQKDDVRLLWSLLEELEPLKREVFILVELEGMSAPEIAEMLQTPLNTVYSRLRAGRIEFEEALARQATREQGAAQCRN